MANQITDNRTLVHAADAVTPYDNLAGAAAGTLDTEIFIQGTGSVGAYLNNTLSGILYDAGSTQTAWANSHFYIWINCGIVGLLDTKANGGFRIRFCGNTVTDFFEFYVGGNDSWPTAVSGGWVQFVVDIEATASNTGGTPPATNACRYVGWAGLTGGTMPRMADNTWIDEIRYLPDNTAGIIVEGRNGGTTDWDSADIVTQLGTAVGTFRGTTGGAYSINAPIQFGINDTTTHGFTDTNAIWLWENQEFAADDLYQVSALGNSGGTTNVTFGVKTGTGDDATGAQGLVISGAATGPIWDMDFNDPNIDLIGLYGCTFINGGQFDLDDPAVSCISTSYISCDGALVSNSEQLRVSVIDANTADGVAFMTTDDLTDIVHSTFEFSDGHAVELTTPRVAAQTSKGNSFVGYGAEDTNDSAVYNNSGGAVTITVTSGGTSPTTREGTGASTTVSADTQVTLTGLVNGTEVTVYLAGTSTLVGEVENVTGNQFAFTTSQSNNVDIYIHKEDYYRADLLNYDVPASDISVPIQQVFDPNYVNN